MARVMVGLLSLAVGCGVDDPSAGPDDTGSTTRAPTTTADDAVTTTSESTGATTTTATSGAASSTSASASSGSSTSVADSTSTGELACEKKVVVMGYWPPTNEMLRPWSTNPEQNPDGWTGQDWGGLGYDVYSFFPEFPPDGDPTNDEIGDDGAVGSPDFDLRVDYQATSADFWRILDEVRPVIVLTTSRGGNSIGWEIEALEGGHGATNRGDPALDWSSDGYGDEFFPTQDTIDARSWDAITTYRQGTTLPTGLPADAILEATSALGLTNVAIDQGTSGNFLSGFLALHGLYWQANTRHAVAAGHIHVGFGLPVADASALVQTTLTTILQEHPADAVACP